MALVGFSLLSVNVASAVARDRLWFYASVNFQLDSEANRLIELIGRASKCGYNGAVVTDYKFGNLANRSQQYYTNLKRVKQASNKAGIELIPCVMPVGYSNSVLQHNPNLAAGISVRRAPMVVHDGVATSPGENLLPGGGFSAVASSLLKSPKEPSGWSWIDGWGVSSKYDIATKHSGNASLKMSDFRKGHAGGNCRLMKTISVHPNRQYQLVVWAKTENVQGGEIQAVIKGGERELNYASLGIQRNQNWKRHAIVFNSMNEDEINVSIGIWGGESGTLWFDSVALREVVGVNLLRRDGCPIVVRETKTARILKEGHDFERWQDLELGMVPSSGKYSDDHDAPLLRLTKEAEVGDGAHLDVSFYHTVLIHDQQVCGSLVHDELFEIMKQQVAAIQKYWRPKTFFLQHDEVRLCGHDELARPGQTCGELLAANVLRCETTVRELSPNAEIVVWSDMFDPHHNAVDDYYLARSTMKGAWKGLRPKVTVANWNQRKSQESLRWFAGRGHKQLLAAYYDEPIQENVSQWKRASSGVDEISGWIYTTWKNNYDDLEAFAKATQSR